MSLKIAVVGAGHLGKIHAKLLGAVDDVSVVALTDPSDAARSAASEALGVPTYASHLQVLENVDGAIIASPTPFHFKIAKDFLAAGKHLLVEKPLTVDPAESFELARLAKENQCVLQVGHVERFNPAWEAAQAISADAKYIEATRASCFPGRCLDVGVVLDLMIHDIDLVASIASGELMGVQASGLSVVSDHEDLAEARLTFSCGLVANLKASRVSLQPARSMQIYGPNGFAELDFGTPSAQLVSPSAEVCSRSFELDSLGSPLQAKDRLFAEHLRSSSCELQPRNAILEELHDFVISIRAGSQPVVDGLTGATAVEIADRVLKAISARVWSSGDIIQAGSHATPQTAPRRAA